MGEASEQAAARPPPLYGLNWAALVCPLLLPVSYLWDLVSYW